MVRVPSLPYREGSSAGNDSSHSVGSVTRMIGLLFAYLATRSLSRIALRIVSAL